MKLYEIILKPVSGFGTPLKGDTLFGQFCWQVAYDPSLVEGGLEYRLSQYAEHPFVVFSSAFPKLVDEKEAVYALKRPDLPLSWLFPSSNGPCRERLAKRKEYKAKRWMLVSENLRLDLGDVSFLEDGALLKRAALLATTETRRWMRKVGEESFLRTTTQPHNTIHRMTSTTGTGMFAPYVVKNTYYYPETELAVFVCIDENATDLERVCTALERIGKTGFGRDASTGLGRFELGESDQVSPVQMEGANACYTLAPCVPEAGMYERSFFVPFTRFGRHGDTLATSPHPFKNPVIMADEGAVFVPRDAQAFTRPFLGRAVTGVSKVQPRAVVQGFAPFLPFRLEVGS